MSENHNHDLPQTPQGAAKQPGETSTVWLIWLIYGVFYFCRTNLSVAVPGMQMSVEDGGLALDKQQIGLILGSLKLSYAFGQLLNGQLSEKISPRVLLALGLLGSAGLNVLFGFATGLYFLIFVWACNGYCQSLGWTPCVRVLGNWVPILRRGKAIGIVGTGYQVTLGLSYIVAGVAIEHAVVFTGEPQRRRRGRGLVTIADKATGGCQTLVCGKLNTDNQ